MSDSEWLAKNTGGPQPEQPDVDELLDSINDLLGLNPEEQYHMLEAEPIEVEAVSDRDKVKYTPEALREQGFLESQIIEINKGITAELDVSAYASLCYNWMQMREIRLGLMEHLNIDTFRNSLYSAEQMREIRLGLSYNLDVRSYAHLSASLKEMQMKRHELMHDKYLEESTGYAKMIIDDTADIVINLSDDMMKATLTIKGTENRFTVDELIGLLAQHDITAGVMPDKIRFMLDGNIRDKAILVAKGEYPETGEDGFFKIYFKGELPESPKVLEDGSVDYTKVVVAERVAPGQLLMTYNAAKLGKSGTTVTGVRIDGQKGKDLPKLNGSNVRYDAGRLSYYATINGYASYNKDKSTLDVWDTYTIKGDANRYQNITYDGSIHVMGSVRENAMLRASGDITVDGFVEGAFLQAGGNIVIRGGANMGGKGSIEAGYKIMGAFFEASYLLAKGPIEANYFLNCNIMTDETIQARGDKSRIIGGQLSASISVSAGLISNNGATVMQIMIADIKNIEGRLYNCQLMYDKIRDELDKLQEGRATIIDRFGYDAASKIPKFKEVCSAIEFKTKQYETADTELQRLAKIRLEASNAFLKAGELHPGIMITIGGSKKQVLGVVYNVTLTKDRSKTPFEHRP